MVLSCAAFVAVVSNCGSSSPAGGTAGSTGSAGETGTAGSTIPTGNGSGGDTTGNAGDMGNGNGGDMGTAGTQGAAGAGGMSGGNAGRNGGGGTGGAAVACRQAGACDTAADTCETTCARGTRSTCACIDATGAGRLEWGCVNVPCTNNTDGGAAGNAGGNDGGAAGRGGRRDGGTGTAGRDGGITIVDGGVVLPDCPANTVSGTTMCTAATLPACRTTCTNNMQQTCICNGNRLTCGRARACM